MKWHQPVEANEGIMEKRPRIEFPCDYPIRVMGEAAPDFKMFVTEVVRRHAPDFDASTISVNASREARFLSVRLQIHATSEQQLADLFADLKKSGRVRMVL